MTTATSADFHRRIGYYQDRALVEPVVITRKGRERLVLLSADEYHRLKRLDRETLPVSALSDEEVMAIAQANGTAEYE